METISQSPTTPTYDDFVRKLFNKTGEPCRDFTHAILGIVTEIHEFRNATDEVNALEELGDIRFYLQALSQVTQDFEGSRAEPDDEAVQSIINTYIEKSDKSGISSAVAHECNELLDIAKRWVGYNKAPTSLLDVLNRSATLALFVNVVSPYPCRDVERIHASNMAKLLKRYPGGEFSQFHALVRDLEAERNVLAAS